MIWTSLDILECFVVKLKRKREEEGWLEDRERERHKGRRREREMTHQWEGTTFHRPTFCDFCHNLLWGLIRQGVVCKGDRERERERENDEKEVAHIASECRYVSHEKCTSFVPKCESLRVSRSFHYANSMRRQNALLETDATSPPKEATMKEEKREKEKHVEEKHEKEKREKDRPSASLDVMSKAEERGPCEENYRRKSEEEEEENALFREVWDILDIDEGILSLLLFLFSL